MDCGKLSMKMLDKYLLSQFIIISSGALVFMLGLYIITIYIDNLKYFSNPNVSIGIIAKYIQYRLPEILIQVLPAAALFTTSYIFGVLNSSNEIIAIYNGKIGFTRLIVPFLVTGFCLTIFSFVFFEYVSTDSSSRAFEIRKHIKKLTGKSTRHMYIYSEFFLQGENNTSYYVEHFDAENGIMVLPVLFRFDESGVLEFQLYANMGQYDKKEEVWDFTDTVIIKNDEKGKYHEERIKSYTMKLAESPKSFMKTPKNIMQMKMKNALAFIEAKRKTGGSYKKELVEFHWRFAFPFSVIIVILIGSVAGIYFRKAVLVLSFFLSIVISFGYYGMLAFGIAYGKSGKLNPVVAAWIANVVYLAAGVIAVRMKR